MDQLIEISQLKGYRKRPIISLTREGRLYIGIETARSIELAAGDRLRLYLRLFSDPRTLIIKKITAVGDIGPSDEGVSLRNINGGGLEASSAKLAGIIFRHYPAGMQRVTGILIDGPEDEPGVGLAYKIIFQTPNK